MASPGSRLTRFPLSAAIDLHETHLAPQSSLQVPVGHIPVPGGIKLCSPGTFWVANYLIINNSSCQVNFTKPNSSTIRYTHSQWLPEDATEALVGKVAVKNPVVNPTLTRQQYRFPSLRHATVPQKYLWAGSPCRRPVRRTLCHAGLALEHLWAGSPCQRPVRRTLCHAGLALEYLWAGSPCQRPVRSPPPSPRRDGSVVLVGMVAMPTTVQKKALPRRDATEVPVGMVAVPKSGQKPPFATPGWLWGTCGQGRRAEQIVRRIIMVEVKVLVGYAPWQMVSGGIGSRKEGAHAVGRTSRHHLSRSNHGPAISPA